MRLKKWQHYAHEGIFAFVILFFCSISLTAQTSVNSAYASLTKATPSKFEDIQPLTVGDRVPDIEIDNIINFPSSSARISDFKGKIILIDFWGTTCASCIMALPKIDSLQREFKQKLQVLTVTDYGNKEQVQKTFQRFKKTQSLQLPVVLANESLKRYFPHEIMSHVVWIDGNGMVRAITGTEYISSKNLQTMLDGKNVNWPIKKDVFDFDYTKPFIDLNRGNDLTPNLFYYSAFLGHLEGVDATNRQIIDSTNGTITYNNFNLGLINYCKGAAGDGYGGLINTKLLELHVRDNNRYIFNSSSEYYAEWAKNNTYCYSIKIPLGKTYKQQKGIVSNDLSHWLNVLGITVKKVVRETNCLVLTSTNKSTELLAPKDTKYELEVDSSVKILKNASLSELIGQLNENTSDIPWVLNETGFSDTTKIDLELHINSFQDLNGLRKELQGYGLDLIPAKREIEMYVITEKGYEGK